MATAQLRPARPPAARANAVKDAEKQMQKVLDKAQSLGVNAPNYELLEITGRGSYGRVYKSKNRETQEIVAVKILPIDTQDYEERSNESITQFMREIAILRSLKEQNVKNVNYILDTFDFAGDVWIVCEFCPGGSLATLMKPYHTAYEKEIRERQIAKENGVAREPKKISAGIEEKFIIAVAREVAVGLESMHKAGIIHRDIKCGNILISEAGQIQLCDFGISGAVETEASKRTTIIGTPHWMAPEVVVHLGLPSSTAYGKEVDTWAFGCAVFEMAKGRPPNSNVRPDALGERLQEQAPRLEGDDISDALCDFVNFCLKLQPEERPTASQILAHQYVKGTEKEYPSESLLALIVNFQDWEHQGHQRNSLWDPGYGVQFRDTIKSPVEDLWNFSTTVEFDRRYSQHIKPSPDSDSGMATPSSIDDLSQPPTDVFAEIRIQRGAANLRGIHDPTAQPYRRVSDLPLREFSNPSVGNRETLIDMDAANITSIDLNLGSVPTIRPRRFFQADNDEEDETLDFDSNYDEKRATQDWRFPMAEDPNANRRTQEWRFPAMEEQTVRPAPSNDAYLNRRTQDWTFQTGEEYAIARPPSQSEGLRPQLAHASTMPVESAAKNDIGSRSATSSPEMIDLDDDPLQIDIPSFSFTSSYAPSDYAIESAATDTTIGDPFDLEGAVPLSRSSNNRGSLHRQSQSEPTAGFTSSRAQGEAADDVLEPDRSSIHARSSSMTRSERDRDRSTSRPPTKTPTRYRQRRQTALRAQNARLNGSADRSDRSDASVSLNWDTLSEAEDDMLLAEQRHWEEQLGVRSRRQKDSGGSLGPTVPPALRARGTGRFDALDTPLPMPRRPNMAALLPGSDGGLREVEMAMAFEELARQAERMLDWFRALPVEVEEGLGGGPAS